MSKLLHFHQLFPEKSHLKFYFLQNNEYDLFLKGKQSFN